MKLSNTARRILESYCASRQANGTDWDMQLIQSESPQHFIIILKGWQNEVFVHKTLIHWQMIDEKLWIWYDGTDKDFIEELYSYGVKADQIELGYLSHQERQLLAS